VQLAIINHSSHDDLFPSLDEGRKPETDCSDNIYSMAMVLASLESAKTGQKVQIARFMEAAAGKKMIGE
jgi:hypothetical protein